MAQLKETPSQTAGPYVHIGLATDAAGFRVFAPFGSDIADTHATGARIRVEGCVFDGEGAKMADVLIEVWQADADGHYPDRTANTGFTGFGRVVPDFDTGDFAFETIKPGGTPAPNGVVEAPHLNLWIVARGINTGLHTRLYFSDEEAANATDPVLTALDPVRRGTLIATVADRGGPPVYRLEIRLQGDRETVFFDV